MFSQFFQMADNFSAKLYPSRHRNLREITKSGVCENIHTVACEVLLKKLSAVGEKNQKTSTGIKF